MPLQIRESRSVSAVTALEACGVVLFQLSRGARESRYRSPDETVVGNKKSPIALVTVPRILGAGICRQTVGRRGPLASRGDSSCERSSSAPTARKVGCHDGLSKRRSRHALVIAAPSRFGNAFRQADI
jgi:hypothetical protein